MDTSKVEPYEYIKTGAALLVVLAHVTTMYAGGVVTPVNHSSFLRFLTQFIYSFHMPLFIAVSGSVFCYSKYRKHKYQSTAGFIISKARRLLVPYLVFGIFYVAPVMILLHFTAQDPVSYIFRGILLSFDSRHLWYLLTLFLIFIIFQIGFPVIEKYPAGVFLFLFCLHLISYQLPGGFQLRNTFRFIIYFYIGYLLEHHREKLVPARWHLYGSLLLLCLFNLLTWLGIGHIIPGFFAAAAGISAAYSAVFLIGNASCSRFRGYRILCADSFGIYLFHPMIIYVLFYYAGPLDIPPIVLTAAVFIIALVLSALFTEAVRRLGLGAILGE